MQGTEGLRLLLTLAYLARALERRPDLGREQGQDADLVLLEVARRAGADDQAAERLVANHQGDGEQASDTTLESQLGRAGPVLVIVDQDRVAACHREAAGAFGVRA